MIRELEKINALLNGAREALLALPAESLQRPRISRERAMHMTALLKEELQRLVDALPSELSPAKASARKADLDVLELRALVFCASDLVNEELWPVGRKTRRKELVRKVREHDRHLSSWAIPVFRKNDAARAAVAAILRGRGLRDDADDVMRLVDLFRQHWTEVGGQVPITSAQLAEAEAEAKELIELLNALDLEGKGSPSDLRTRAFTVWLRTYDELFHLARYLLRGDASATQRLNAISAERAAENSDEEDEESESGFRSQQTELGI